MFMRQKFSAHLCFNPGKAPGKYLWKPAPSATYWTLRWGRDEQKKLWRRCWSERKRGYICSLGDLPSRCVVHVSRQHCTFWFLCAEYCRDSHHAWHENETLSNRPKVRGCQVEVPTELKPLEDLATSSNWSEVQAAGITGQTRARRRAGMVSCGAEHSDLGSVLTVSGSYIWFGGTENVGRLGSDVSPEPYLFSSYILDLFTYSCISHDSVPTKMLI